MLNCVLLSGPLTEERLKKATREIQEIVSGFDRNYNLLIDSKGGDMQPTVDFVSFLWTLSAAFQKRSSRKKTDPPGIKIYTAESAAALIALAAKGHKEMAKDAELGIHRGAMILEAADLDLEEGKLNDQNTVERFRRHEKFLKQVLDEGGLSADKNAMSELYGSGWLRLSAEECLKRGIVQRLF